MIPIMTYTFDTLLATKYGINEAIMLNNLIFWIAKNEANGKHFHDGRYWTYNSVSAMERLYPFWTTSQIRTVISSLIKQGVLLKGNYNDKGYDRTMWYGFTDEFLKSICQNSQMDLSEVANGIYENGKPIPDKKPSVKNPSINTTAKEGAVADAPLPKNQKFSFKDSLISSGATAQHVDALLAIRKDKRLTNTERAYNQLAEAINTVCNRKGVTTDEVVAFMIAKGWGGLNPDWAALENLRSNAKRRGVTMSIDQLIEAELNANK